MSKITRILFVVILALFGVCGCQGNKEDMFVVQTDSLAYMEYRPSTYTVDDEGCLYAVSSCEYGEDNSISIAPTVLHQYDLEGNLLYEHTFSSEISFIYGMSVIEGQLYFVTQGSDANRLAYALKCYDMKNDVLEEIASLGEVERILQMVCVGKEIYITVVTSQETKLLFYSLEETALYEVELEESIISIAPDRKRYLLIYTYNSSDQKNYIVRFDSKKNQSTIVQSCDYGENIRFAVCDNGNSILYTDGVRGLILCDLNQEGKSEIDAGVNSSFFDLIYMGGQVFCVNDEGYVARFVLDSVAKKNKVIHYISQGAQMEEPFGCGYKMVRNELEEDKFALKVLAQDKDYDLCVMNTYCYASYNIRKNGKFYPLNDVEGIDEYLEQCHPYIKEAATNEEGEIWMLPIGVNMPGLLVNEENLKELNLALTDDYSFDDIFSITEKLEERDKARTSLNQFVLNQTFFYQYFNQSFDVTQKVFTDEINLFKKYSNLLPKHLNGNIEIPDNLLYEYIRYEKNYRKYIETFANTDDVRFYEMPKINHSYKNVGNCTFLAVNPGSSNLKAVLNYIEDYLAYIREDDTKLLYLKQEVSPEDSLLYSAYTIYQNGTIGFAMDVSVFDEGFDEVVQGKMNVEDYVKDTQRKLEIYLGE